MKIVLTGITTIIYLMFSIASIHADENTTWWPIQSIDTMKYSRDKAREKANDASFDKTIDTQMQQIRATGANYVAIGTPYDEEFIPYMKRWVQSARKHDLHVWFRGNFSGWEGWFSYQKISKERHTDGIRNFIEKHVDLFEDNDIFTPCTECENGVIGDPRKTGDVDGFRSFLKNEYTAANTSFKKINKKVQAGYFSMNYDVAKLVMDEETTKNIGGIVVIDHYVKNPEQLGGDMETLREQSRGKILIGETGAPIPDIHGGMNEGQQADWIDKALGSIAQNTDVLGVNYWVSTGGSTQLWEENGKERMAVSVISSYFSPKIVSGIVTEKGGKGITDATVKIGAHETKTDSDGGFEVPIVPSMKDVSVSAYGYEDKTYEVSSDGANQIVLERTEFPLKIQLISISHYFITHWFAITIPPVL